MQKSRKKKGFLKITIASLPKDKYFNILVYFHSNFEITFSVVVSVL